jgi:DNA-directed RNA polymerase specialized sigma24 family protein
MAQSSRWDLDAAAFESLLARLDPDRQKAALEYENLRRRLIRIFTWEQLSDPASAADEGLSRLARRLREGEPVQDIPAYLHGIARNLKREELQRRSREQRLSNLEPAPPSGNSAAERLHQALEDCLNSLEAEKRDLVLAYYQGDRGARIVNRQKLAGRLGLQINALRNRALRIREGLEECVRSRLERDASHFPGTQEGSS